MRFLKVKTSLQGIVISRNNARTIERTLSSLEECCDDILILDQESSDSTLEIARHFTSKIYYAPFSGKFENLHKRALELSSADWTIFVDGDEELSPSLVKDLRDIIFRADAEAYYVARRNYVSEDDYLRHASYPDLQLRLLRRSSSSYHGGVHEAPEIKGTIRRLPDIYFIVHHQEERYTKRNFREHTLKWVRMEANQKDLPLPALLLVYLAQLSSVFWFLYVFFARKGFLDGMSGFLEARFAARYHWQLYVTLAGRRSPPIQRIFQILDNG